MVDVFSRAVLTAEMVVRTLKDDLLEGLRHCERNHVETAGAYLFFMFGDGDDTKVFRSRLVNGINQKFCKAGLSLGTPVRSF